jgi:tryptophan synthase beta chain
MGEVDTERQALNVARMRLLGAEVDPGHDRLAHPQGRDQRGAARLGRPTSTTRTTCSARSPARTRSRDGARLPPGHRPRPARRCSSASAGCPTRLALRRRRLQRDRHLPRLLPTTGRAAGRLRGRRRRRRRPAGTRATSPAGSPGVLHGADAYLLQDETARPSSRTRSRPGWTTRASARARAAAGHRPRGVPPVTDAEAMDGVRAAVPHRGDHPGDRDGARARRRAEAGPGARAGRGALVNLSGRGDKDVDTAANVVRHDRRRECGGGERHGIAEADLTARIGRPRRPPPPAPTRGACSDDRPRQQARRRTRSGGVGAIFERCRAEGRPRSSATCRRATRRSTAPSTLIGRWSTGAAT